MTAPWLDSIHSLDDPLEDGVRPNGHVSATVEVVNGPDHTTHAELALGESW